MDKLLAHIDIAQENGTTNPGTAHSRIKAKTNEQLVSRSSAGVESVLGGSLSVLSRLLTSNQAIPTDVDTVITGLQIQVPPGKTARVWAICITSVGGSSLSAQLHGGLLTVNNPAGANGSVSGAAMIKGHPSTTTAAGAASTVDGDSFNLAAGATFTLSSAISQQPGNNNNRPFFITSTVVNLSTNTSAVVSPVYNPWGTNDSVLLGSSLFALIS